tara:strand:+ start:359 stop:898 length:540 start_codon:yes stop_codon:yes gene_type:complete
MPKAFSLRGVIEIDDNAVMAAPQLAFAYESPNRTKAWRITGAWVWPQEVDKEIGTSDLQGLAVGTLLTDTASNAAGFNGISNVSDNRQCAWHNAQYNLRAGGTDFLTRNGAGSPDGFAFLIDEDTVVVNGLYINFGFRTESATSPSRKWNYMITLEEKKVTAWESIFQQIKGMGQDIDN